MPVITLLILLRVGYLNCKDFQYAGYISRILTTLCWHRDLQDMFS